MEGHSTGALNRKVRFAEQNGSSRPENEQREPLAEPRR